MLRVASLEKGTYESFKQSEVGVQVDVLVDGIFEGVGKRLLAQFEWEGEVACWRHGDVVWLTR